jgi:hypothetical protein
MDHDINDNTMVGLVCGRICKKVKKKAHFSARKHLITTVTVPLT